MSNPFAKHGINWLSPSALNCFQNEPALWCARYLFGIKDESGPAAKRGSAVEAGLDVHLFGGTREEAKTVALQNFAMNTQGEADEAHELERALIPAMLDQACEALPVATVGRPNARQLKIEYRLDGIEVPIVGYLDYIFDEWGLDLKTTKRMPSDPDQDHLRQIAIYQAVKDKPFKLLYVTDKRRSLVTPFPSSVAAALRDMGRMARAMRKVLDKSDCREEVAEFFVPNRGSYRWNEQTLKEAERICFNDNDRRTEVVPA